MTTHRIVIEGIGFWASGLPNWEAAKAYQQDGLLPQGAARRPSPELLPPNERRRAPDSVALAIEVAQAACRESGCDLRVLSSVFASTHGELAITEHMCATLARDPCEISPTKFHNSVHNAAAGYWTIGNGCMAPATAISAYDASFAQGLIETIAQLVVNESRVLLVGYDAGSPGPLAAVSRSEGLLGGALVLSRTPRAGAISLDVTLENGAAPCESGRLGELMAANAMAPMLPLFALLADASQSARLLRSGPRQHLRLERVA
jgi:hypothetical protein